MPVATYEQYTKMLDHAQKRGFAYPAINVSSPSTANAVLQALAESKADGIIQVSTGGAAFAAGQGSKDMVLGAMTLAQHVHLMADKYNVLVALHTDHCQADKVESFLIPLIEASEKRRARGEPNLFNSHMFDGSELPLDQNVAMSEKLLKRCAKSEIILEVETGVVGGEEDGVDNEGLPADKLYTTAEEMVLIAKRLKDIGRFMYAATFGNVHGVYKPGNVKLRPDILKMGQDAVAKECGGFQHQLVFHGGSGSELSDIHSTLTYGVVKMNVDTDTQYTYTRPVADFMLKNYDRVLKIDGEVGSKKHYDPRAWLKLAEESMKNRVVQAVDDLKARGTSLLHN